MANKLTLIPYYGGKSHMLRHVMPVLEAIPHRVFVDVFGGSGNILLNKKPVDNDVYNDIDDGLVCLFSVLRDRRKAARLRHMLTYTLYARSEHALAWRLASQRRQDDVLRAWAVYVMFAQSFSGKGYGFGYSILSSASKRFVRRIDKLKKIIERMHSVIVENLDFERVIKNYDSYDTLFYCDPPYVICARRSKSDKYAHEMTDEDHCRLVRAIMGVSGFVVLSGYSNPIYDELERNGWTRLDFAVPCSAVGRTRASGIRGNGVVKQNHMRVESLWLNPRASEYVRREG